MKVYSVEYRDHADAEILCLHREKSNAEKCLNKVLTQVNKSLKELKYSKAQIENELQCYSIEELILED